MGSSWPCLSQILEMKDWLLTVSRRYFQLFSLAIHARRTLRPDEYMVALWIDEGAIDDSLLFSVPAKYRFRRWASIFPSATGGILPAGRLFAAFGPLFLSGTSFFASFRRFGTHGGMFQGISHIRNYTQRHK